VFVNLWHAIELKLPLLLLILAVWWFIREEPEDPAASDEDGGTLTEPLAARHPHRPSGPRSRGPRSPRRGPHGEPATSAPARVRTSAVRSRSHLRS
jgi:hypothetical protein